MNLKPCKQCGEIPQIKTTRTTRYNRHSIKCCNIGFNAKSIRYAEDVIKKLKEEWNKAN